MSGEQEISSAAQKFSDDADLRFRLGACRPEEVEAVTLAIRLPDFHLALPPTPNQFLRVQPSPSPHGVLAPNAYQSALAPGLGALSAIGLIHGSSHPLVPGQTTGQSRTSSSSNAMPISSDSELSPPKK